MDSARSWKIYKVTCLVTGKSYVGLTCGTVRQRWSNHISCAFRGSTLHFHRAIRKHGASAFSVEVIATTSSLEAASALERAAIVAHRTLVPKGYNLAEGGMGTPGVRRPHSEETKERIRIATSGRVVSEHTRMLLSAAHMGHRPSEKTKKKLSMVRKGRVYSEAHRESIAAGHRGRTFPARSVALLKTEIPVGSPSTSGYRGVTAEGQRWIARIGANGKRIHLGVFDTPEEAHEAYKAAVAKRIAELTG